MKQILLASISLFLFTSAMAQCNVAIPASATPVTSPQGLAGSDYHMWVCDSLSHSGFDHFFYIESGGYTSGSGIGITSWLKSGGEYASGGIDDTVYYEPGAIFTTTPDVMIACPAIVFDYTNAPTPGCITPPTAGISASTDTVCAGTSGCMTYNDASSVSGTATYNWSFPGGVPGNSTDQNPGTVCYMTPGTYTTQLQVTDSVGTDIASFEITVLNCVGMDETDPIGFDLYPNPATDQLFISSKMRADVQILDLTGRVAFEDRLVPGDNLLDIKELVAGIYIVEVSVEGRLESRKLIVE